MKRGRIKERVEGKGKGKREWRRGESVECRGEVGGEGDKGEPEKG